ncbi:monovalent cation/H(+) antiporter subunit G [Propionicicella superfundia]|uniref:monovalent cation/H(+) antiporter subunit G n=1 Tax=Propionicicella superfundia TaxID=348582 RepID=UPI00041105D5|nr:monovalent cation/H(+) antiporter subunit G [Propionicicella superfundia]
MTTLTEILDIVGALFIAVGAFFALSAAVAQVRFPDVLARMHAATKPQVLGVLLVLAGVFLIMPSWPTFFFLTLVSALQLVTAPISSHMVARTAYRATEWAHETVVVDELRDEVLATGVSEENLRAALLDGTAVMPPEEGRKPSSGS